MGKQQGTPIIEDERVKSAFEDLLRSYGESNHRKKFDIINKAFQVANQAHKGVKRRDGDPYIMHPLAVARIVCEDMGLGSTSIASALLHDVVEDADYTVEDIRNLFGDQIALIVDGLTKISGGILVEAASAQAENMRKLLLTMSADIRVILIKIADRLHNMRTLGSMLPAKQYKIAGETMYLYAPMAHRLGLFSIKTELEDLSFKYEFPEEYRQIGAKLEVAASNREKIYGHFAGPLYAKLDGLGIQYKMQDRVKSVYSIWKKMQIKKVDFSDVYDIFAVRIVFTPRPDVDVKKQCWDIYSVITDLYTPRPERLRDWVSHPKANGYQALHLTVMGPDGQWIEVQIRSEQMDEIAERGLAAHWKYKEKGSDTAGDPSSELDRWLERIQEVLEAPSPNAMDFLNTIKLNLYASEIFVFTPKGQVKTMPQRATALDFAYEIHTNVGDHCIGAKVNHKLVPLSHKLSSGDQVEILTSRSQTPQHEWLNYVTTAKAKTKIEAFLRRKKREKIKEGEQLFTASLETVDIALSPQLLDKLVSIYGYTSKDDFYFALGEKLIELPDNLQKFLKDKSGNFILRYMKQTFGVSNKEENSAESSASILKIDKIDKKKTYILDENDVDKTFLIASCCNPIPGDEVLGFLMDDQRLEVHKRSCPTALILKVRFGTRIISCEWAAGHKLLSFKSKIEVKGIDRLGLLNEITIAISHDCSVNIRKLAIETNDGFFEGTIELFVHDVDDINKLTSRLQKIKGVKSVIRAD